MRNDCRVMSSHVNLIAGVMRLHLDTINYIGLSQNNIAHFVNSIVTQSLSNFNYKIVEGTAPQGCGKSPEGIHLVESLSLPTCIFND